MPLLLLVFPVKSKNSLEKIVTNYQKYLLRIAAGYATMFTSTREIDMEITILMLVLITFLAGIVGGIVIADATDTHENRRRQRRAKRQARREKNRKNVNFTIDKF